LESSYIMQQEGPSEFYFQVSCVMLRAKQDILTLKTVAADRKVTDGVQINQFYGHANNRV
jgi:hypothetical protein